MSVAVIDYNSSRWTKELLEQNREEDPSFSVHLHEAHWSINNSGQFMYGSPISTILDEIRACRIPNDYLDLFDKLGVQFFEGCLIVALYDHRPRNSKLSEPRAEDPDVKPQRIVLQPTHETLYADIKCLAEAERESNRPWSDQQALELEARILNASAQPLCLDPDVNVTRIANRIIRATAPAVPRALKRKRNGDLFDEDDDDDVQRAQRTKLMQFMNPRAGRAFNPRLLGDGQLDFQGIRTAVDEMRGRQSVSATAAASQSARPETPLQPSGASAAKGKMGGSVGDKKKTGVGAAAVVKTESPSQEERTTNKITIKLPPPGQPNGPIKREGAQPGRVGTPVQAAPVAAAQVSTQQPAQPAQSQPAPHQGAGAGNAPGQVAGMPNFQAVPLPNNFLQQPPASRAASNSSPAPGMMAGKRPQTPQQHAAMVSANVPPGAPAGHPAAPGQPGPSNLQPQAMGGGQPGQPSAPAGIPGQIMLKGGQTINFSQLTPQQQALYMRQLHMQQAMRGGRMNIPPAMAAAAAAGQMPNMFAAAGAAGLMRGVNPQGVQQLAGMAGAPPGMDINAQVAAAAQMAAAQAAAAAAGGQMQMMPNMNMGGMNMGGAGGAQQQIPGFPPGVRVPPGTNPAAIMQALAARAAALGRGQMIPNPNGGGGAQIPPAMQAQAQQYYALMQHQMQLAQQAAQRPGQPMPPQAGQKPPGQR